ncbi:MAG: DUF1450 domain-containing protein [Deltaproteobacteria bacterium]|nr:DUF1450 domain-containing protein [Deltaproteobacteria bacterium]TLN02424.1 MAG: DUF1450 domain-containing protein [bacterium]
MKVRLCEKNKGKAKVAKRLEEEISELDLKIKKCIDLCNDCSKTRIARVDGKKVVADEVDELVKKITKSTKE